MAAMDELQAIFRDVFDDPSIELSEDFSPWTYNAWDSLATLRLVLSVEQQFAVRFTTDQIAEIKSVREILAVVAPGT
jgi:acyl carrier protein